VKADDPTDPPGSRRRRLWELDSHAHCPVIGVCLPLAALRRLMDKAFGGPSFTDDYELHCAAVTDARQRSPLAEALQRELDRRYMLPLRQAAKAKTTEALATWWDEALHTQPAPGRPKAAEHPLGGWHRYSGAGCPHSEHAHLLQIALHILVGAIVASVLHHVAHCAQPIQRGGLHLGQRGVEVGVLQATLQPAQAIGQR
jgi:hypothetical protein